MTTEWKEIKTLQELAQAQADGWDIEVSTYGDAVWEPWYGFSWLETSLYRSRPKQYVMKKVKSLCWRHSVDGALIWRDGDCDKSKDWQRFPAGDIEGEVEDD